MTRFSLLIPCAAALFAAANPAAAQMEVSPVQPRGVRKLSTFDYQGVRLADGPLRRLFDQARDDYLRIPNDDLLKGFRARAGRPAPGVDLGGWYTDDVFHVFGQILSGLARMYAATGDSACRDKVKTLLLGWGRCIAPDGYFFYSAKPNAPHYIYDKTVCGLVDAWLYCHEPAALLYLNKITDWAIKNLDRKRPYSADPNEWYTLSENLYRAYLATGDIKYRDVAKVWEYTEYWGRYADKKDIFAATATGPAVGAYHAYSHVNTLSGAGAAYLVTGERRYRDTLVNAYDYLRANQCFATGGFGPNEQLLPRPALLDALANTHNTFETQCGSWAVFKLCKYLLTITGDARYGDWIEQMTVNGISASIPMSPDGRVFYYSDYCPGGGAKRNTDFGWSCCTGTRPQAVADFYDLIYFHDADSLYVNLFTPSSVRWSRHGQPVTIRQTTPFPRVARTTIEVSAAKPVRFALKIRKPDWTAGPAIISGSGTVAEFVDSHGWITIRRAWKPGERVTISFPVKFRLVHMNAGKPYPAALVYGPVVMAFRQAVRKQHNPARFVSLSNPASSLEEDSSRDMAFHLRADPNMLVRPFYDFKEGEPYFLTLDPAAEGRFTHRDVTFKPVWNDAGMHRFTNIPGATAEFTFEGTGIRWLGWRFDDAGRGEVQIDGKVAAVVDQYGPGRGLPFDWRTTGLPPGRHTIRITLLPDKNPASRNRYLNVAGFQVFP